MDSALIEQIYEAAVLPEKWPAILHSIAKRVGATGGLFMSTSQRGGGAIVSPDLEEHLSDYISEGWAADPLRTAPLMAEQYPGFRAETDYRSVPEIEALPVHREFLDPRGLIAGAATAMQGAIDNSLFLAFEGFRSHEAASDAIPFLDTLRSHLARAFSLAAHHHARTQLVVDSLALAGAAAAVVGIDGRLRAANDGFVRRMAGRMTETVAGLRFADPFLQRQLATALLLGSDSGLVQSIAVRDPGDGMRFAIHLLPIARAARDVCGGDGVLLLIADGLNAVVPNADLLRLLFDLTPAEARLSRMIGDGMRLAEAGNVLGMTEATARVHLKSVFLKTGVRRQSELMRLLVGLSSPAV